MGDVVDRIAGARESTGFFPELLASVEQGCPSG